jgi:hypothetical protein
MLAQPSDVRQWLCHACKTANTMDRVRCRRDACDKVRCANPVVLEAGETHTAHDRRLCPASSAA